MRLEVAINEAAGERLDRLACQLLPELSRSRIQRAIELGEITVHGALERPAYRVKKGDVIIVEMNPDQPVETDIVAEDIPLDVLFEDDDILVINKQAPLIVHPAPGIDTGTLVNALVAHCADIRRAGRLGRPGLVHRLDKDTTGVLIVAKTEAAHMDLTEQIRLREVEKIYHAVCYGCPEPPTGYVSAPIGRHPVDRNKMTIVEESHRGRHALTNYLVKERYPGMSLLRVDIETGRTHQIRVHLNHIGHPCVGDPQYGRGISRPKEISVRAWQERIEPLVRALPGQALHAAQLTVRHPTTEERMTFKAPWKSEFLALIRGLRLLQEDEEKLTAH
jgi:23S rRNA pseudouridine1911/1915/1917 synthase